MPTRYPDYGWCNRRFARWASERRAARERGGAEAQAACMERDERSAGRSTAVASLTVVETAATGTWVGTSVAFAFLFAPVASRTIVDVDLFATLIERTIGRVVRFSMACGTLASVAAVGRARAVPALRTRHLGRAAASGVALALLAYHERAIVPSMNAAKRAMGGSFADVAEDDPARRAYRARHRESTRVYGAALLLGLGVLAAAVAER